MEKIMISVAQYSATEKLYDEDKRINGTYLHGNIQDDFGYDIFSFNEKKDMPTKPGIYHWIINEKPVTFFLAKRKSNKILSKYMGLMVYDDDKEFYIDAIEKYIKTLKGNLIQL